jgi:transposase InsO family protein
MLSNRAVFIGEHGQLCGLHDAHRKFRDACRDLKLTVRDYPLNHERQGLRSLGKAIRKLATRTFADAARMAGAQRISPPWSDQEKNALTVACKPFDIVEFDGHKIDINLQVSFEDAGGVVEHIKINRVWLLVIIDVFTRAILGWNVVLSPEYNRHDVMRTIQQALMPQRKRTQLSIPGLSYAFSGGFVGEVLPFLDGACWDHLRLDNARANLAADTLALLSTVVGCLTEAGPVGEPTERPFVERFFGTMETTLYHRLQGTTGSHPRDIRRRLMNPKGKESLPISFDELLELTEVCIANYNGSPHSGIGDRTPLEFLTRTIEPHRDTLRVLSEPFRRQLCILQPSQLCPVKGSLQQGRRPYINLHGVKYSSRLLQQATDLIGTSIRIYMDPQDMRVVHAYLSNGAEFGPLNAARPWHRTKHSLRLRQEIQRLRRARKLHFSEADDPVQAYLAYKRAEPVKRKAKSPHRTAEATRSLHGNPGSAAPVAAEAPVTQDADPVVLPVAKPRQLLLIGKGQAMKVRPT